MHRVTSIVDAAPSRLFRSRRSPAHSGTAATRSRRAAECPYHPAGGDVQPVARRVRGLEADVEAVHAEGQLDRDPRGGWWAAVRRRAVRRRRPAATVQPCRLVVGGSGAGRPTPSCQPPGRPHRPNAGLPSIARDVTRARAAASRGSPAAPAGARGPIGPWSSCKSSGPSRGRRHRRRGTSRTDGDTQARRPRDLAYLWHWSMAGRVRVPTVRDRRMPRGGRLQGRPAAPGQTGTAAPLEATGARSGSGRHRPGC